MKKRQISLIFVIRNTILAKPRYRSPPLNLESIYKIDNVYTSKIKK